MAYRTISGIDKRQEAALITRAELINERATARAIAKEISAAMRTAANCLLNGEPLLKIAYQHEDNLYKIAIENAIKSFKSIDKIYSRRAKKEHLSPSTKKAIAYIAARGGEKIVAPIVNTTIKNINDLVSQGIEQGLGLAKTAKKIREAEVIMSRHRANTIARTETHFATMNASYEYAIETANEYGFNNVKKEWIAAYDAREAHLEANEQVVDFSEPFIVGGEALQYAGDPNGSAWNVINCRCVVSYLYD